MAADVATDNSSADIILNYYRQTSSAGNNIYNRKIKKLAIVNTVPAL
jgi:hypothetical protein